MASSNCASEHQEQVALFEYVRMRALANPAWDNIFSVPNGAYLAGDAKRRAIQMKRLKLEGLRAGVPDIFVAVPRLGLKECGNCGGQHRDWISAGLFIEMKRKGNAPTIAQINWHKKLIAAGYDVKVCYSADEAIKLLEKYMRGTQNTLRAYEL